MPTKMEVRRIVAEVLSLYRKEKAIKHKLED